MATRRERILNLLRQNDGLTDREITDILEGHDAGPQYTNQLCHRMVGQNILFRRKRGDGRIGNYLRKGEPFGSTKAPKQGLHGSNATPKHPISNHARFDGESLKKLISLGFEQAGRWLWDDDDLNFELTKYSKEKDILYAFIVDGEVKYIGKSIQTLHKRIYLYKNCGPSQRTNIRVRDKIRNCLKNGSQVLIYAFVQNIPLMYQDIPINLAAGLEDNIISSLKPEWNIR
ncbi:MAG: GIY-YIG nuclease family protein [Chloroflexota bacterium]|nr:GIY-YIG nuclease family protein [Chloroflexota bacterium]